ncbi:MAG TPA: MATE family efflux transporter [Lachnospiraceae bacterium]|nr:MATE family efflux transporter [Lachnospiraceae bacterium]
MENRIKNMTEGRPVSLIVAFALPLMAGNVFQQLYSVVDSMVVGKVLGVNALAALGASTWPNWVMLGILQGLTQGFSIIMAQAFGAKDIKRLRMAVGNSIVLSGISSIVFMIMGQLLVYPMLQLLKTPSDVISYSLLYLRLSLAGIPIVAAYNLLASILRALGDGQTPLRAMVLASVVNVVLDILFVRIFFWGIAGAAIATLIAQFVSCIFCFKYVRKIEILHLKREHLHIQKSLATNMLAVSSPMALQNVLIAGGGMIVQSVVNQFSIVFIAGFTAGSKLHGVLEIATSSYGFAMTTYVGQNLGARRIDRIRQGVRSAIGVAVLTSVIIAAVMLLSGKMVISGFVSGNGEEAAQTISVAYQYLAIMCICLPVLYILYVFRSSLQGMGNTVLPMVSGIAELIMRTSAVLLLPGFAGETGVFLAEVLAWAGADVVLIASYIITIRKISTGKL